MVPNKYRDITHIQVITKTAIEKLSGVTTVTVIFTVLYWRLCCQYSTVNFTIKFLECVYHNVQ